MGTDSGHCNSMQWAVCLLVLLLKLAILAAPALGSVATTTEAPTLFSDPTKGRCYCSPKATSQVCSTLIEKEKDANGNEIKEAGLPKYKLTPVGKQYLGEDFDVSKVPKDTPAGYYCQILKHSPIQVSETLFVTPDEERPDFQTRILKFCNMVDYKFLLMDLDETYGNDTFAEQMYDNFQKALALYNCYGSESSSSGTSSSSKKGTRRWTCKDCRDAYKNWLCAALFRRCHVPNEAVLEAAEEEGTEIPVEQQGAICQNVTNDFCPLGVTYKGCSYRTCFDVCYKVVRNCPVHLHFKCPPLSDEREYTNKECNSIKTLTTAQQTSLAVYTDSQAKLLPSAAPIQRYSSIWYAVGFILTIFILLEAT